MPLTPSDEPPWVTAALDQRLALMRHAMGGHLTSPATFMMTTLTEPPENATAQQVDQWERRCDRCGRYRPPDDDQFVTGFIQRTVDDVLVMIAFGACSTCL